MSNLKDSWKKTGKGFTSAFQNLGDANTSIKKSGKEFGHAFRNLGKSVIKSAKEGIVKVDEWANSDDEDKTEQTEYSENS